MPDSERIERDAVRAHIVKALTDHFDNDETTHQRLSEAARTAIISDFPDGSDTLAEYRRAYYGQSTAKGWERRDYADSVGVSVLHLIQDMITQEWLPEDTLIRSILFDLLDFGDREIRFLLGDHYLPDPDDDDLRRLFDDEDRL